MKRGLADTCCGLFSTLANPTRLAIMEKLRSGPMNVSTIATELGQEQSMISHNLMPLERYALVYSERKGKGRAYRLNTETMGKIFEAVESHAQQSCPAKARALRCIKSM
ncbi:metalloregulator ArsR/SmtB family transcription factor [Candidatus Bathyarchaeota archaeon]|nr:metalloregulator ArsR/SmtB family transcription factor [Candidatus Bathyarchaeota archaeon]